MGCIFETPDVNELQEIFQVAVYISLYQRDWSHCY